MQQTKERIGSPRKAAQQKFDSARNNLLLMLIFTVINIVMYVWGTKYMLLFSATVPYMSVVLGTAFQNSALLTSCVSLAVICMVMYLLCWIFSKKHFLWMITAAIMFALDTLAMVILYFAVGEISGILDFMIHIWVMYYLILGAVNGYKLRSLPQEEPIEVSFAAEAQGTAYAPRLADTDVKARILLEEDVLGHRVCYRRVKRVNELVIDGYVYDEMEMLMEVAHSLDANIDGHHIQVGFNGSNQSYLNVDGKQLRTKIRFW